MSVLEIECQLAQAQLQRYISGSPLEPEVKSGLEQHLATCEGCRAEAKLLKEQLRAKLLKKDQPVMAAVHMPAAPTKAAKLIQTLNLLAPASGPEKPSTPTAKPVATAAQPGKRNLKPLIWSGALASVLVAMSFVNDPTKLLGEKAMAKTAPVAAAATTEQTERTELSEPKGSTELPPLPNPEEAQQQTLTTAQNWAMAAFFAADPEAWGPAQEEPAPQPETAAATPPPVKPTKPVASSSETRRVVPSTNTNRPPRKKVTRAAPTKKGVGSIRVYDPRTGQQVRP